MKKKMVAVLVTIIIIGLIAGLFMLFTNMYIINTQKNNIYDIDSIESIAGDYDCIIVLGAGVRPNGTPSDILTDRIQSGVICYNQGLAPKIIMSGDHGRKNYDEVNVMKSAAIDEGIASEDIFMDHAGFSTYDTMYRAKEIFNVQKAVIVTQKFHLYRSMYLAEKLGIECVGVSADLHRYRGESYRESREMLARTKDFVASIFKPKPKYLGEVIPVSGNGNLTNDK